MRAPQFFKELLRNERLTIGRYDSRVTDRDEDAVGETPDYDPSFTEVLGVFSGCFNNYVRQDLIQKRPSVRFLAKCSPGISTDSAIVTSMLPVRCARP